MCTHLQYTMLKLSIKLKNKQKTCTAFSRPITPFTHPLRECATFLPFILARGSIENSQECSQLLVVAICEKQRKSPSNHWSILQLKQDSGEEGHREIAFFGQSAEPNRAPPVFFYSGALWIKSLGHVPVPATLSL